MDTTLPRTTWELLWYGGISMALLGVIFMLVSGLLVTRGHHQSVVDELRNALHLMTEDRDEWRTHAADLRTAIDRLADAVQLKGRR